MTQVKTELDDNDNNCGHNMDWFKYNATALAIVHDSDIKKLITTLLEDQTLDASTIDEIKSISKDLPTEVCINVKADVGVGGAGKTMSFVHNTCRVCALMVSPYRENKNDLNTKHRMGHSYCNTYVVALNNIGKRGLRNIIVDELFAHNFTMLAVYTLIAGARGTNLEFFGTGDNKQITAVDWDGSLTKPKVVFHEPYRTVTHRNPQSVVDLCKGYIPGITTTSKVQSEVIYKQQNDILNVPIPEDKSNDCAILCFTREMRKTIAASNPKHKVLTVGMAHSKTISTVHLYTTDIKLINENDRVAQMYTAVSRTSRQLIIYGEKGDLDVLTTLNGSTVERALDNVNNMPLQAPVVISKSNKIVTVGDDGIRIKTPEVNTEIIVNILNGIYKQVNEINPYVADINPPTIPFVKSEQKFKVDTDMATPTDSTRIGKMISSIRSFNRLYTSSSKRKALSTFVGRYANRNTVKLDHDFQRRFRSGVEKFLKPNYKAIALNQRASPEMLWFHCTEALKILQSKFPKQFREVIEEGEDDWFIELTPEQIAEATKNLSQERNLKQYERENFELELQENPTKQNPKDREYHIKRRAIIVAKFLDLVLDPNANESKYQDLEREFNEENNYHRLCHSI